MFTRESFPSVRDGRVPPGRVTVLRVKLDKVGLFFHPEAFRTRTLRDWVSHRLGGSRRPEPFWALRDVSLELEDGDCLGIVGPNGSGKTTLVRVIAGIFRPDTGRVWVRGRMSSLLMLGAGFDPALSGRDNAYLSGLLQGISCDVMDRKFPEIAEMSGLGEFLDRPVAVYSTGMVSRLGFAVACAAEPDVLMLDEIFSVGDAEFIEKARRAMERMLGKTACQVIVSHDLSLVSKRCNKAVYLRRGRVAAFGPPAEVIARYSQDVVDGTTG